MDSTLIVALIAGIASLVVAVVSMIATLINGKNTTRTAESLERLKNDFSHSNRALDILDSETKATLQNLKDSIHVIQKLRNEMQRFRIDKETALATGLLEKINSAAESVIETYNSVQATLSEDEKDAFHNSKKLASLTQLAVQKFEIKTRRYNKAALLKAIPQDLVKMDELEIELAEKQRILWTCRAERILDLSQKSVIKS